MLTMAPLPDLNDLLRGTQNLFQDDELGSSYSGPEKLWKKGKDETHFWFSRSSWAIALIVKWYQSYHQNKKEKLCLWFPEYFCNQSLWPIRQMDAHIVFYPIKDDYTPDWDELSAMAKVTSPDLFFLVHYFGQKSDILNTRNFCKIHKSLFVEDCSHVLIPFDDIGKFSDFSFYSPHKLLPIPDGAILLTKMKCHLGLGLLKDLYQDFAKIKPSPFLWIIKKLIQKGARPATRLAKSDSYRYDPKSLPLKPAIGMSSLAKSMLSLYTLDDFIEIGRQRFELYQLWSLIIELIFQDQDQDQGQDQDQDQTNWKKLDYFEKNPSAAPYMAVYEFQTTEKAQNFFEKLISCGLPASTWPDLPPEVLKNPSKNKMAEKKRFCNVVLPNHHSLSMNTLVAKIRKLIPLDEHRLKIDWNKCDHQHWEKLLQQIPRSNLLQKWEYGEAKEAFSKKMKVKRGIISKDKTSLAMVQTLQMKWPVLGQIIRVNRGPLWLDPAITPMEKLQTLWVLRKQFRLRDRKIFLYAPELEHNLQHRFLLKLVNFRNIKIPGTHSAWFSLEPSLEQLKKQLKSKWRNQLNFAEKHNIEVIFGNKDEDLLWIIECYEKLQAQNKFKGPPSIFYLNLLEKLRPTEDAIIIKAFYDKEVIAAILLIKHGQSCTYLMGWNGEKGRRLNANNILLWTAIKELKQRGCAWFDLGGLDDIRTPAISHFKRGICGQEYRLVPNVF